MVGIQKVDEAIKFQDEDLKASDKESEDVIRHHKSGAEGDVKKLKEGEHQ